MFMVKCKRVMILHAENEVGSGKGGGEGGGEDFKICTPELNRLNTNLEQHGKHNSGQLLILDLVSTF